MTASAPAAQRGEIVALTSLRGVAAMAVVMQHFSATAQSHSAVNIPSLVPHGYLAVDLFFVLSGFIMSYTYLRSFRLQGMAAFGPFLMKRVARIVPLNVAVLALFMLAGGASMLLLGRNIIFQSDDLPADLLANLLMLQGLGIGHNSINGPSWSISTEFAAYLLFPAFVFLVLIAGRAVSAVTLLAGVIGLCWLASLHPRLGLDTDLVWQGVLRCFTEFAIGMGSYRLFASGRFAALLGRDSVAFGLMAACLGCMALRVDLPAALLFAPLIVALAANRGRAGRFMANRVFHFLGVVSFSVYLIHAMFRPVELEILRALHPVPLGGPAALVFALAGSFSVVPFAWLTYSLIERPGRTLVRRLSVGGAPATVP